MPSKLSIGTLFGVGSSEITDFSGLTANSGDYIILEARPVMIAADTAPASTTNTAYQNLDSTVILDDFPTAPTGTTVVYKLMAKVGSSNASGVGYVELYDVTGTASVANSEVAITGATIKYDTSAEISLTSGRQYRARHKSNNGSYTCYTVAAWLLILAKIA